MEIERFLEFIIPYITGSLELVGVFIILLSSIKTIIIFAKEKFNWSDESIKLSLARGLALSLEFKLAAEILKTVVVRSIDEFIVLSAVVILRVILTFVIHWEIKSANLEDDNQEKETETHIITQNPLITETIKTVKSDRNF